MSHFVTLRLQISRETLVKFDKKRHALADLNPAVSQSTDFVRIVGHQANAIEAEIEQNLRALFVATQVNAEPESLICLDSIGAIVLESIGTNLIDDADAATLLLLVDDRAATFLGDQLECCGELLPAVAFDGAENVAGHALRMYTCERRYARFESPTRQYDEVFVGNERAVTDDSKIPVFSGQSRLGRSLDCLA